MRLNEKLPRLNVLTAREISRMASAAGSPRDRALIAFMYATGLKICEAQQVNWVMVSKQLQHEDFPIRINVPISYFWKIFSLVLGLFKYCPQQTSHEHCRH